MLKQGYRAEGTTMHARYNETGLPLFLIISFFFHGLVATALFIPDFKHLAESERALSKSLAGARDIIVNINEDNIRQLTPRTLLGEKDSSARGHITLEKGDRWLNNSRDFTVPGGKQDMMQPLKSDGGASTLTSQEGDDFTVSGKSGMMNGLAHLNMPSSMTGGGGSGDKVLIPDKNGVTMKNAIYYSNDGTFSFNTAKFKNFKYFKAMKDRIASNWYPPIMANAVFGGYNPTTGGYAPGAMRIMAIPSQQVKIFFTMNRKGEILDVYVIDSMGNESLNSSCVDSIRLSRSFGRVPDDITGDVVGIPFIFGYYVY